MASSYGLRHALLILLGIFTTLCFAAPRQLFTPVAPVPGGGGVDPTPKSVRLILPGGVQFSIKTNQVTALSRQIPGGISSFQVSDPSVYGCCIDIGSTNPICLKVHNSNPSAPNSINFGRKVNPQGFCCEDFGNSFITGQDFATCGAFNV